MDAYSTFGQLVLHLNAVINYLTIIYQHRTCRNTIVAPLISEQNRKNPVAGISQRCNLNGLYIWQKGGPFKVLVYNEYCSGKSIKNTISGENSEGENKMARLQDRIGKKSRKRSKTKEDHNVLPVFQVFLIRKRIETYLDLMYMHFDYLAQLSTSARAFPITLCPLSVHLSVSLSVC